MNSKRGDPLGVHELLKYRCTMIKYQGVYPNLPTFSERINYADNVPMSQKKIAAEVGIAQPTFSNLLSGKNKTCDKLDIIARKLGVDYQWLVTGGIWRAWDNG